MKASNGSEPAADGVAAVDRALAIVEALVRTAEPITLADLSRSTGLYKSTLLRLLASLERASLAVRRTDGRYALGPFSYQLGRAYEATYHLTETILPLLRELVDQGSESASFHVYHDPKSRLCLMRVDSHHSTLDRIRAGDLLPLQKGAPGRLLSAGQASRGPGAPLALVQVSMGERDPNCAAVASPVFGPNAAVCGVISLSGPKERFKPAAIKKMSKMVQEAASRATHTLGGTWPIRQ